MKIGKINLDGRIKLAVATSYMHRNMKSTPENDLNRLLVQESTLVVTGKPEELDAIDEGIAALCQNNLIEEIPYERIIAKQDLNKEVRIFSIDSSAEMLKKHYRSVANNPKAKGDWREDFHTPMLADNLLTANQTMINEILLIAKQGRKAKDILLILPNCKNGEQLRYVIKRLSQPQKSI